MACASWKYSVQYYVMILTLNEAISMSWSSLRGKQPAVLLTIFGRPVDVLELHAIRNRRLRYYIEQNKLPVYAAA